MSASTTGMFVLGALARHGALHGHAIRRQAALDRTERWSEVKVGSLYQSLRQMDTEGLIEAVRTEQEGRLPARTVYAITDLGWQELVAQRDVVLRDAHLRPDPVDLALVLADDLAEEALAGRIADRVASLRAQAQAWAHQQESAWPWLSEAERQIFAHYQARLDAELSWHESLSGAVPKIAAEAVARLSERRETSDGRAEADGHGEDNGDGENEK